MPRKRLESTPVTESLSSDQAESSVSDVDISSAKDTSFNETVDTDANQMTDQELKEIKASADKLGITIDQYLELSPQQKEQMTFFKDLATWMKGANERFKVYDQVVIIVNQMNTTLATIKDAIEQKSRDQFGAAGQPSGGMPNPSSNPSSGFGAGNAGGMPQGWIGANGQPMGGGGGSGNWVEGMLKSLGEQVTKEISGQSPAVGGFANPAEMINRLAYESFFEDISLARDIRRGIKQRLVRSEVDKAMGGPEPPTPVTVVSPPTPRQEVAVSSEHQST